MATTSPLALSSNFPAPNDYGKECKPLFFTSSEVTNLNHGSFGTIPRAIQSSCEALTREVEENPDAFIRMGFLDRQTLARRAVASLIGADDPDTCIFVSNVSTGMNTVLQSFNWSSEDYIICTDAVFASITLAIENISPNPQVSSFGLGGLESHESILCAFRAHVKSIKDEIHSRAGEQPTKTVNGSPKVVVVMESITATPALLLPWREMVHICNEENVWSIVDAAHSLGQENDLNIAQVNPDFWIADCAKWYYAMRGCSVMYVPLRHQKNIKPLVPGVHHPTRGPAPSEFVHSFFWNGLTDPVACLSIEFAIAFRNHLGGDRHINAYCHHLAVAGGRLVALRLGTSVMDASETGELTASITNIELPISSRITQSPAIYFQFDDEMIIMHKVNTSLFNYQKKWWVRASAQIYNDMSDFERLATALQETCRKINCYGESADAGRTPKL